MRPNYSNVVASLALFVALGGTSYAVTQLPRDSVGDAQIRKGAVRSSEVRDRSLKAIDFVTPSSLRGPPGKDGTAKAYALVGADGTFNYSSGLISSRRTGVGRYCVDASVLLDATVKPARAASPVFSTPANVVVTPVGPNPRFATAESAQTQGEGNDECRGQVAVFMFEAPSGQAVDGAFYIAVN